MFCLHILKLSLDTIGDHEKISILGNLGVDADTLASWDFQPDLLLGRVKLFREFSHDIDKGLESIIASAERRFALVGEEV